MKRKLIYLDGAKMLAEKEFLNGLVPGVRDRQGVFETVHGRGKDIYFFDEHFKRLLRGLKVFGIKADLSDRKIFSQIRLLMAFHRFKESRIRISIWKETRKIHTAVSVDEYVPPARNKYITGFNAHVSSVKCRQEYYSHIKSLKYALFQRAFLLAQEKGFDEAILLNRGGFLTEASRCNLFFVRKERIFTPSVKSGCLSGITRRHTLLLARKEKIKVSIGMYGLKDLMSADEAFLTNSLIEVMPLTRINGKKIGTGRAGDMTRKLMDLLKKYNG